LITSGFSFLLNKPTTTENFEKKKMFFLSFCYNIL
ncbi:unnamed protein product, partial [Staurois parvus]